MLKKRLGIECMERSWYCGYLIDFYKIPSTLTISNDCTWIGARVFYYCNRLKEVVISGSVESIGFSAFEGCKKLGKVEISGNVDWINSNAFRGCTKATIILKKSKSELKYVGKNAFIRCKSVEYAEEKARN